MKRQVPGTFSLGSCSLLGNIHCRHNEDSVSDSFLQSLYQLAGSMIDRAQAPDLYKNSPFNQHVIEHWLARKD